jgi:hypothetical protein
VNQASGEPQSVTVGQVSEEVLATAPVTLAKVFTTSSPNGEFPSYISSANRMKGRDECLRDRFSSNSIAASRS